MKKSTGYTVEQLQNAIAEILYVGDICTLTDSEVDRDSLKVAIDVLKQAIKEELA